MLTLGCWKRVIQYRIAENFRVFRGQPTRKLKLGESPTIDILYAPTHRYFTCKACGGCGLLCLGAHAQVRYTVVCLCVCVCVCVCRVLQLLNDKWRTSYRLLVMFSSIAICGFVLELWLVSYLESHCSLFRTVQSETCPWSVANLHSS